MQVEDIGLRIHDTAYNGTTHTLEGCWEVDEVIADKAVIDSKIAEAILREGHIESVEEVEDVTLYSKDGKDALGSPIEVSHGQFFANMDTRWTMLTDDVV